MNPNSPGGDRSAPDAFKPPEYAVKFICTTDEWRQFRGYVFERGKTTTIRDKGTIEALNKHPDFRRIADAMNGDHVRDEERPILTLPKRRSRPPKSEANSRGVL